MLRKYLDKFYLAYLDNILIFLKTKEEYKAYIKKVLEKLEKAELPLKLKKCKFKKNKVTFLEYVISEEEITTDLEKIKAIKE